MIIRFRGFSLIAILIVFTMILAPAAFAGYPGTLPQDNTPFTMQNVRGISPVKAASSCVTKNLTHGGTIATFNVTDSTTGKLYSQMFWSSFKSATDSTAVIVKRSLDTNTAYMPASNEYLTIGRTAGFTQVKFATFTNTSTAAASANYTVCADFQ